MTATETKNTETTKPAVKPATAAVDAPSKGLRDMLALPPGDVMLRKVKGPNGTHEWLGHVQHGRVYVCGARAAVRIIAGGEFEVLPEYEADVKAAADELKKK